MSIQAGDFSELFGSEAYSDVSVVLYEEPEHASSTAQHDARGPEAAEEVLPCHRVVLRAFSQYFKTKIDNWSDEQQQQQASEQEQQQAAAGSSAGRHSKAARTSRDQDAAAAAAAAASGASGCSLPPTKPQIKLPVPSGQLPVGRLLLKSMYEAAPALSDISQAQLVQLIVLADRYEVPKVAAAAAAVLSNLPDAHLEWDTVFAVYRLPAGCAGLAECRQLQKVAASKVQHELGDLEVVWSQTEKQQVLLMLPYPVILQLLLDSRTSVASEDTVLFTLERWFAWQQQHVPPALHPSNEELRELVSLVRMRACSRAYVASVFAAGAFAERALQRAEIAQAVAIANNGSGSWPVQKRFYHWDTHHCRPRSNRQHHTHSCSFTSKQLKGLYQEVKDWAASAPQVDIPRSTTGFLADIFTAVLCEESESVFKGVPVSMAVRIEGRLFDSSITSRQIRMYLGIGIRLPGLPKETVLPRFYSIQTDREPGQQGQAVMIDSDSRHFDGVYIPHMVRSDGDSWADFKAWMVQEGWTRPDGSMVLSCQHGEGRPAQGPVAGALFDADGFEVHLDDIVGEPLDDNDDVVADQAESGADDDDDDESEEDEQSSDLDPLDRAQIDEAMAQLFGDDEFEDDHEADDVDTSDVGSLDDD